MSIVMPSFSKEGTRRLHWSSTEAPLGIGFLVTTYDGDFNGETWRFEGPPSPIVLQGDRWEICKIFRDALPSQNCIAVAVLEINENDEPEIEIWNAREDVPLTESTQSES
jgi:hypothetical protein